MENEKIINGINVSICSFFDKGKCNNPNICTCNCSNTYYCYFKEHQREKQVVDNIKKYIKDSCNSCQGIKYGGCEKCKLEQILNIIKNKG